MDRITNRTISVGTSQVQIASDVLMGQRKFITVINTSTGSEKITLAFNQDAVSGQGVVLSSGGSYTDTQDGTGYFPSNTHIQAICDSATGKVAIVERIGAEKYGN